MKQWNKQTIAHRTNKTRTWSHLGSKDSNDSDSKPKTGTPPRQKWCVRLFVWVGHWWMCDSKKRNKTCFDFPRFCNIEDSFCQISKIVVLCLVAAVVSAGKKGVVWWHEGRQLTTAAKGHKPSLLWHRHWWRERRPYRDWLVWQDCPQDCWELPCPLHWLVVLF